MRRRKGRQRSHRLLFLCVVLSLLATLVGVYIRMVIGIVSEGNISKQRPHHQHAVIDNPKVSYNVHAFYYPWYCNPQVDGMYMHWNHKLIPHWDPKVAAHYPDPGPHQPDRDDLGASFFPLLGPYSSADPTIMRQHMQMLEQAGIGVAVVSWLPTREHDENGLPIARLLGALLEAAAEYGIRIAIHMEPYQGRNNTSVRWDVEELISEHGDSPALYRLPRPGKRKPLPLLYFYDQYHMPPKEWNELLTDSSSLRGGMSIRGTQYDVVALALIVERTHWDQYVTQANFDGGYTYFAANTFTYGSRPSNWAILQEWATRDGKFFVPSVGPGYDDTRVRRWNSANTKNRKKGRYFDEEWQAAIDSKAPIISITTFNEWHEGTQIEPAVAKTSMVDRWKYEDYESEGGPNAYLKRNKEWVDRWVQGKR